MIGFYKAFLGTTLVCCMLVGVVSVVLSRAGDDFMRWLLLVEVVCCGFLLLSENRRAT